MPSKVTVMAVSPFHSHSFPLEPKQFFHPTLSLPTRIFNRWLSTSSSFIPSLLHSHRQSLFTLASFILPVFTTYLLPLDSPVVSCLRTSYHTFTMLAHKSTLLLAVFAIAAKLAVATPPACLLAAVKYVTRVTSRRREPERLISRQHRAEPSGP